MRQLTDSRRANRRRHRSLRRGAFTLVEIMVALAIFLAMMVIIFMPLNMGLNLFGVGKSRTLLLQAAQTTLDDMEGELRKAITVFPNAAIDGITYNGATGVAIARMAPAQPIRAGTPTCAWR